MNNTKMPVAKQANKTVPAAAAKANAGNHPANHAAKNQRNGK